MGIAALFGAVVLAVVFGVAGVTKLRDRGGAREAVVGFGVPAGAVHGIALALPIVELAVAAALVLPATRRWAAGVALVLLGLFVAAITVALFRGRRPECHCFGQLHSAPVGSRTIARNAALGALAAITAAGARTPLGHVDRGAALLTAILTALAVAVIGEGLLVWALLRRHGQVLLRLDALEHNEHAAPASAPAADTPHANSNGPVSAWGGLPVGAAAPDFDLPGIDTAASARVATLLERDRPVMLVFSDPGCGPCAALMPTVAGWQRDHAERLTIAVISAGEPDAVAEHAHRYGLRDVYVQHAHDVADAYRYLGTPGAVVIDPAGRIASRLAAGAPAIQQLLDDTLAGRRHLAVAPTPTPHRPEAPPLGEPAFEFHLPDLAGNTVSLADYRGRDTLLVFWNAACGFCQRMADDLKRWEDAAPTASPALVLIAAGDAHANDTFGFRSPVLADPTSTVAARFGVAGTPIGILVDADGRVASAPAPGADAVLAALGAIPA